MFPHKYHERKSRSLFSMILLIICSLTILAGVVIAAAWALSPHNHNHQIPITINDTLVAPVLTSPASTWPLMEQTSVFIALIGRDVATELPYVLANIEGLSNRFKRSHVVLVENDSRDGTVEAFLSWGVKFNVSSSSTMIASSQLISFKGGFGHKSIGGLAIARNKYIDAFVATNTPRLIFDYLIAVDTDMCFAWEQDRIAHAIEALLPTSVSLSSRTPHSPPPHGSIVWDVLLANGACGWYRDASALRPNEVQFRTPHSSAVYCDLLALRDSKGQRHTMGDTMVWFIPGSNCDLSSMNNRSRAGFTCQMQGGQAIVPVHAGFGGWGMYSHHLFMNGSVGGCRHDEQGGACEHDSLNECIGKRGGRIIVATDLVVDWEGCALGEEWRLDLNSKRPW